MILFVFHFPLILLVTLLALKSDWLFCFSVVSSLAGKKMQFKAKSGVIHE